MKITHVSTKLSIRTSVGTNTLTYFIYFVYVCVLIRVYICICIFIDRREKYARAPQQRPRLRRV